MSEHKVPDDLREMYEACLTRRELPLDGEDFVINLNARTTCNLVERIARVEAERDALNNGYQEVMAERLTLREDNATLRAALARMQEPVTDAELSKHFYADDYREAVDALLAARAGREGNDV